MTAGPSSSRKRKKLFAAGGIAVLMVTGAIATHFLENMSEAVFARASAYRWVFAGGAIFLIIVAAVAIKHLESWDDTERIPLLDLTWSELQPFSVRTHLEMAIHGVLGRDQHEGGFEGNWDEFVMVLPKHLDGNWPSLANHGPNAENVKEMRLHASVQRTLGSDNGLGMPVAVQELSFSGDLPDELGLYWRLVEGSDWFVASSGFAILGGECRALPELSINWNQIDVDARAVISTLVGSATLSLEIALVVDTDRQHKRFSLSTPFRLLGGLDDIGDGGVTRLVDELRPVNKQERDKLLNFYSGRRQVIFHILRDYERNARAADEAQRMDDLHAAFAELNECIDSTPEDGALRLLRARRLLDEGLVGLVEPDLQAARELALKSAAEYADLARGFLQIHRPREALQASIRVLDMQPQDAVGYELKGEALAQIGENAEALRAYERSIALDSSSAGAHLGRARMLSASDEHAAALDALDLALEHGGDEPEIQIIRALQLVHLQREQESIAAIETAVKAGYRDLDNLERFRLLLGPAARLELTEVLQSLSRDML
jgi:tetratricopeptide (TPR) repeat protein